jgi:small conductance mechanosensitive channel
MFMLVEDQYGVDDIVDLGEAMGVVEEVSLRTTRIRDVNGAVWYFPNGEIRRVCNQSQQWARSVLDIAVAYGTDIDRAIAVILEAAESLWQERPEHATLLEKPEVWGVQDLGDDSVAIRLVVKTEPGEQWAAGREIRRRILERFEAAGIEIPFPQRSVHIRSGPG